MAEIIKINDSTWRIEDGHVRFFLFCGTSKAALIDSGMTTVDAKEIIDGKASGTIVDMFGTDVMLYKFPYAGFLCEIREKMN